MDHKKAREFQKKWSKAFDHMSHNKLWTLLKVMGVPGRLTHLLRNPYAGQETTVRIGHGKMHWFTIGKGVFKAVYCHPGYLTLKSTSCEMLVWMKHKLESRVPGKISTTLDKQMIEPLRQKVKRN